LSDLRVTQAGASSSMVTSLDADLASMTILHEEATRQDGLSWLDAGRAGDFGVLLGAIGLLGAHAR
jgi:glycerate kinase